MTLSTQSPRRRILVAVDGSPAAATALPVAHAIATQLGAHVTILHVAATAVPHEIVRQRLHLEEEYNAGAEIHLHLGEPASGILHMNDEPDVLLTVLTTHGRMIEPREHLGSVAEQVVAQCMRPILVVTPESEPQRSAPFRRLLLPLDGTPTTARALRPVTALAKRLRASVDVLYVANVEQGLPTEPGSITAPIYLDQPQHEWPEWMREVITRLLAICAECPPEVSLRVFLSRGEIGSEIVRFSVAHEDDMIVLVRRSRLEPERAHVLRAVLHHAPCPVLLTGIPHLTQLVQEKG